MTQPGRNVFFGICCEELELALPLNTWESRPDGSASVTSPRAGRLQRPWGPTWPGPGTCFSRAGRGAAFIGLTAAPGKLGKQEKWKFRVILPKAT